VDTQISEIKTTLATLSANMEAVKASVVRMEKLDGKQTKILETLASNEAEHKAMRDDISILRERTHKLGNEMGAIPLVLEQQKRLQMRADNIEERVESIEVMLPNMKMASGWVFKAALAVMGLLGTVSIAVIVRGL